MKIEHDELVAHLHQARRERLKSLYELLGRYELLGSAALSPDNDFPYIEKLLERIRALERLDIFQRARELGDAFKRREVDAILDAEREP